MQGRLLPKYNGRYQAHPVGYWEDEFPIASDLGLKYIEFIFDYNDVELSPLMSDSGIRKITDISSDYNVNVKTVCADYFMAYPLHSKSEEVHQMSMSMLNKLITQCKKIGITDIIIPCVDQSSLNDETTKNTFINKMKYFANKLDNKNINLSLETDLNPTEFFELINKIDSPNITVNYDLGNSSSLGYDLSEEFDSYGSIITDIHIKDRSFKGNSVFLGKGDVEFPSFFYEINKIDYKGPLIMQVFRDEEGVSIFNDQLNWLRNEYEKFISFN